MKSMGPSSLFNIVSFFELLHALSNGPIRLYKSGHYMPKVISAMEANKLLNQGTWSILTSVVDTREIKATLTSESVVRDYLDVFPKNLPGFPLYREINFGIELEQGTTSISKAPYRMAPT